MKRLEKLSPEMLRALSYVCFPLAENIAVSSQLGRCQ